MKVLIEAWIKGIGKKKFLLVEKRGFFGGGKWVVGEVGFWGPKKIGEANSYNDALYLIELKYGPIVNVKILRRTP